MQNGPVDKFTALTGTIFVTISVFESRGHFRTTFGQLPDNFQATFRQLLRNRFKRGSRGSQVQKQVQTGSNSLEFQFEFLKEVREFVSLWPRQHFLMKWAPPGLGNGP